MEITEEIISELKKDDGHTAHFNYFSPITKKTRIEFIIDSIKNLNVENIVHVGCAGHVVKIQEQIFFHYNMENWRYFRLHIKFTYNKRFS